MAGITFTLNKARGTRQIPTKNSESSKVIRMMGNKTFLMATYLESIGQKYISMNSFFSAHGPQPQPTFPCQVSSSIQPQSSPQKIQMPRAINRSMSSIVKSIVNPEAILIRFGDAIPSRHHEVCCWWYTYPSKNMKVSWEGLSHMWNGKKNPNHQPAIVLFQY